MSHLSVAGAAGHDLAEWFEEVAREVGIDHQHIAEQGVGALLIAVAVGTVFYLLSRS
jgi:hypothetical protein